MIFASHECNYAIKKTDHISIKLEKRNMPALDNNRLNYLKMTKKPNKFKPAAQNVKQ